MPDQRFAREKAETGLMSRSSDVESAPYERNWTITKHNDTTPLFELKWSSLPADEQWAWRLTGQSEGSGVAPTLGEAFRLAVSAVGIGRGQMVTVAPTDTGTPLFLVSECLGEVRNHWQWRLIDSPETGGVEQSIEGVFERALRETELQHQPNYVSVIGPSLVYPILGLLEELESVAPAVPNAVQSAPKEVGLSCGIIVLAVTLLESATNRVRMLQNAEEPRKPTIKFLRSLFQNAHERSLEDCEHEPVRERLRSELEEKTDLLSRLEECIAARDAIVHNHLWDAHTGWDDSGQLQLLAPPQLRKGHGDKKLSRVLRDGEAKSRSLALNLFPTRIWRRDAYLVLQIVAQTLEALQRLDYAYFPLNQSFRFQSKSGWSFYEIAHDLSVPEEAS